MELSDNIREILLPKGKIALVDANNYDWLNQFNWSASCFDKNDNLWYAWKNFWITKDSRKIILMHRLIMDINDSKIYIDHRNGNGLDNYKSNLRICTPSQNQFNRRLSVKGTSKYKGVCWNNRADKWQSQIVNNCKQKYLGLFESEIEAALAYDSAAKYLFGSFANLNFK